MKPRGRNTKPAKAKSHKNWSKKKAEEKAAGVPDDLRCPPGVDAAEWAFVLGESDAISSIVDAVPPGSWGFEPGVQELLRLHRHKVVDAGLSKKQRAVLPRADRLRLAKALPQIPQTISHIWSWLRASGNAPPNRPNAAAAAPQPTPDKPKAKEPKAPKKEVKADPELKTKDDRRLAHKMSKVAVKDEGEEKAAEKATQSSGPPPPRDPSAPIDRTLALKRLQDKIGALKEARGATAPDFAEKKRLKRRLSVVKRKEKKRIEKASTKVNLPVSLTEPKAKKQKKDKDAKTSDKNEESNVVYTKFNFALSGNAKLNRVEGEKKRKGPKDKAMKLQGKDFKRLLQKVEGQAEKVAELEWSGQAEAAAALRKRAKWDAALQRSEGQKVKDDAGLLRKSLRAKEKLKGQKAKKWEGRLEATQGRHDAAQEKRKRNLDKRRTDKKKTASDKAKKKGR